MLDCIALGTVSNTACITSINYSTNPITLGSTISRSPGNPVWLYKKSDGTQVLYGTRPDIGALPFVPIFRAAPTWIGDFLRRLIFASNIEKRGAEVNETMTSYSFGLTEVHHSRE